jgi:hypothetical protein
MTSKRSTLIPCLLLVTAACGTDEPEPLAPKLAFTAYVHGRLAQADLAAARSSHDQIAAGGEADARAAGDHGHHVFLGTGEPVAERLDTFLGLDEWETLEGAKSVYGDPDFQAAFSSLFAEPVAPELYRRRPDWHTWGDLKPPAQPYWVMTVKGHLAQATEEANRAAHDMVAAGFQAQAEQAGDIAHVPHIGIEDPRLFFNVDVSINHEGMLAVLVDPQFQQAFGSLFDAPPEVHIYRSTDWKQW